MLLQRGIYGVDDHYKGHFDNPKVANTLAFYTSLVAGPRKVAAHSSGGVFAPAVEQPDGTSR